MPVQTIKTRRLMIAYEDSGPKTGEPIILLHGWPDSPRTWDGILPKLHEAGYRTIAPYIRGYGPSKFRDPLVGRKVRRTGQPVALAQDVITLADRLRLDRFFFVGHDWGARAGYALAALYPKRVRSLVALADPFQPGKAKPPNFPQARAYWYQWLLCTYPGEVKFRRDPIAFGKAQWDGWSPHGWYTVDRLAEAAESWKSNDFVEVVLHSYRSRWGHAELDPAYYMGQQKFEATSNIGVPTMLIHGREDACVLTETTEGAETRFSLSYRRVLLEGVGHFPQRENPVDTAEYILQHLKASW